MLYCKEFCILSATRLLPPYDICNKIFSSENLVKNNFEICHFTIINMNKEHTIMCK